MKHFVISIIISAFALGEVIAQSQEQNYIATRKMIDEQGHYIQSVQYYDGLGFPTVSAATTGTDGSTSYSLTTYDGKRREEKKYLPVPIGNSMNYLSPEDIISAASSFHSDGFGYTQNHYDALDRVTSIDLPGREWRNNGKDNGTEYSANTDADKVKHYEAPYGKISLIKAENSSYMYYPAGTLRKETTHDADGKTVTTFTNLFGEKILERTAAGDTYYVYNDLGQLRYVLTPKYQSEKKKELDAYEYRYDARGRMVKKILPGCGYTQYWYDKADRLLYVQDSTLRERGKYRFMLYDALGRLCVQGLCDNCKRSSNDGLMPKVKIDPTRSGVCGTSYILDTQYANTLLTNPTLEVANYYDNYNFTTGAGSGVMMGGLKPDLSLTAKEYMVGYQTGSIIATTDGGHIATVQWNDIKGNPLGHKTRYPNGVIETGNSEFTFTNNVSEAELRLSNLYGGDIVMKEANTYSNVTDLLTGTEIRLNHGANDALTNVGYTYDQLGRLTGRTRQLNSDAGSSTVNYAYDMRGWTREISTTDGFMEQLLYQDGTTPCYNGNISAMKWKNSNVKEWIQSLDYIRGDVNGDGSITMSDVNMVMNYYLAEDKPSDFNFAAADVNGDGYITMSDANQIANMYLSGTSVTEYLVFTDKLNIKDNQNVTRSYRYVYYDTNRLKGAAYSEERVDGTTPAQTPNYTEMFSYDKNGNITNILRNGKRQNGEYGNVDNLAMTYTGNQLTAISDWATPVTAEGSTDYKGERGKQTSCTYNGVGSLTSDEGRNIALIKYDNMNNPSRIQFTNGNVTKYVYSATGEKLRTIHQTAAPNITVAMGTAHELTASEMLYEDVTDYYLGGKLTVKNGKADKYYFDGGYAQATADEANNSDDFAFFYYNSDHLGNVREVIDEKGDVVQITNYYPFGTPYSAEDFATHNPDQQDRKYNGKEFDATHGLNAYDYGARQYCSLFGRWDRMDPLCEKYYSVSPYAYCANNPVKNVDYDGKEVYLFSTSLPGANWVPFATHTFIVVQNRQGNITYAAYGPKNNDPISGNDVLSRCNYSSDKKAYTDYLTKQKKSNHVKGVEIIPVPNGMSSDEFDSKVVDVINEFGNNPNIRYKLNPTKKDEGNCNSSSSTILKKSGVSNKMIDEINDKIEGFHWGFSSTPKPWTKSEQKKIVEEEKLRKEAENKRLESLSNSL
ncbi:MAG: hypothetical protein II844_04835 [Prevotella sp.]|nr:hypothetical protein [Prevotella sp.]